MDLSFSANFTLNNVSVQQAFSNLTSITQATSTLATSGTYTVSNISNTFFINTEQPVTLTLTNGLVVNTISVTNVCLLTSNYDSVVITNPSPTLTSDIFVLYS